MWGGTGLTKEQSRISGLTGLTGLTGLMGLRECPVSPVSPSEPEIPDCAFVSPVPPSPPGFIPGFIPCHPGKFLKFYSKSKVERLGRLGGVVCRWAY